MRNRYDVIIIGAGITGAMTAYKLARFDLAVLVVDAAHDVASGTTKGNSAIVHAGFDAEPGTLKARLNVPGCAQIPEIAAALDVEYKNCGSLVCAFSPAEVETLRVLYERGVKNGVRGLEIFDRDALRAAEPNISPEAVAALYAPTAGIVCPWGLCIAACECAAVNGCSFKLDYRVSEIKRTADGLLAVSDGKESFEARFVVNAAGLGADGIALCAGDSLPFSIIPRRGEYMLLDHEFGAAVSHVLFSVPTERGKGILVSPTVHGNLILGPNAEVVGDKADTATTSAGIAEVRTGALKLLPTVALRGVITNFAGVRATPSTGDFYIEPSDAVPGLLHAAGIESPGLASSPAIADYIVEKLTEMGLDARVRAGFRNSRPPVVRFAKLSDAEKSRLIAENPSYGKIICRCETITEGEITDAIRRPVGARDVDGVKRRVRAGMGRCQGGFCSPRVTAILARELECDIGDVTKKGGDSKIVY